MESKLWPEPDHLPNVRKPLRRYSSGVASDLGEPEREIWKRVSRTAHSLSVACCGAPAGLGPGPHGSSRRYVDSVRHVSPESGMPGNARSLFHFSPGEMP